jgi:predicted cupin superfamily sugar epimerase
MPVSYNAPCSPSRRCAESSAWSRTRWRAVTSPRPDHIPASGLPSGYGTARAASTAIYYLLTPDTFSAMHRLASDEIFHFYLGDPVEMLHLHPDGTHQITILGPDLEAGQRPQVVVQRHIWQGARLIPGGQYALLGTTVAPGFDYTDYETAPRPSLLTSHPAAKDLILALTR